MTLAQRIEHDGLTLTRLDDEEIADIRKNTDEKFYKKAKSDLKQIQKKRQKDHKLPPLSDEECAIAQEKIVAYLKARKGSLYTNLRKRAKPDYSDRDPRNSFYKSELIRLPFDRALENLEQDTSLIKNQRETVYRYNDDLERDIERAKKKRKPVYHEEAIFGNNDRIYYRIEVNEKTPARAVLERILNENHYDLSDYKNGYCTMRQTHPNYTKGAEKNPLKVGRVLNQILSEKGDDAFTLKQGEELFCGDELSSQLDMEAVKSGLKKKFTNRNFDNFNYDTLVANFQNDGARHSILFALSRNTQDIQYLSTDRAWFSCLHAEGKYAKSVPPAIQSGAFVSYIIFEEDLDIQDPFARVNFMPHNIFRPVHKGEEILEYAHLDLKDGHFGSSAVLAIVGAACWPVTKSVNLLQSAFKHKVPKNLKDKEFNVPSQKGYGMMKDIALKASNAFLNGMIKSLTPGLADHISDKKAEAPIFSRKPLSSFKNPIYYEGETVTRKTFGL